MNTVGIFYLHYQNRRLLSPPINFIPNETYTLRLQLITDKLTLTVHNSLLATDQKILAAISTPLPTAPTNSFYLIYIDPAVIKTIYIQATAGTQTYELTPIVSANNSLYTLSIPSNSDMIINNLIYTPRNPTCSQQQQMTLTGIPNIPPNSMLRITADPNNPCNITPNIIPLDRQFLILIDTNSINNVSANITYGAAIDMPITLSENLNYLAFNDVINDPTRPITIRNLTVNTPTCGQLTHNGEIIVPPLSILRIGKDPNSCTIAFTIENLRS